MYQLTQNIENHKKVHESNIDEKDIDGILESYESLFHHMGFQVVVSVSTQTELPVLKIWDNGKKKAVLTLEKE